MKIYAKTPIPVTEDYATTPLYVTELLKDDEVTDAAFIDNALIPLKHGKPIARAQFSAKRLHRFIEQGTRSHVENIADCYFYERWDDLLVSSSMVNSWVTCEAWDSENISSLFNVEAELWGYMFDTFHYQAVDKLQRYIDITSDTDSDSLIQYELWHEKSRRVEIFNPEW
jgi:hypothetical protein